MARLPWVVAGFTGMIGLSGAVAGSDPWADGVVSFVPGEGSPAGYDNPGTAIGEPTRYTGEGVFPGAVTPFNPPYLADEIVSIGRGGELVVSFDEPVSDDPANPFAVDLIVFGDAFYFDDDFPNGRVGGLFGTVGSIAVSPDGSTWVGITPGAIFPSLGFSDLSGPYVEDPGLVPTDFTRPVDPAFDAAGRSFAELVVAYAGSGGGCGIDIASSGFDAISYVRISTATDAPLTTEIDAIADVSPVPAPGLVPGALLFGILFGRNRAPLDRCAAMPRWR